VDEVLHTERDEVVAGEPEEVGRGDDSGGERSQPEPPCAQVMALRRQDEKGGEEADDGEGDGVFGEHANADADADTDPVSFVAGAKEASGEEDDKGPGEQVEGVVLQDGAEGEPDGKYGKERDDLGWSASA